MAKAKSWADIKAAHSNTRREVTLVMDSAAALEAKRLADELATVDEKSKAALTRRMKAAEQKAGAITFAFVGVGRARHALILAENPPTKAQKKAAPAGMVPRYNLDTFPPALLAEACHEPAELHGDVDAWTEIYNEWSDGQTSALWNACLAAQAGVNDAPKSVAASAALASSANS